jgi:hypothetical protein
MYSFVLFFPIIFKSTGKYLLLTLPFSISIENIL